MTPTPLAPDAAALGARLRGTPFVILLDVDGTLAPIAPHPDQAAVPARTKEILRALALARGVHVALVSGRAAADARTRVGVAGLWVLGNHGLEMIDPDGVASEDERVRAYRGALSRVANTLAPSLSRWPGSYIEDKRLTLSVHYRQAGVEAATPIGELVRVAAAENGLRVTEGSMVFEVRPPVAVDKGTAVRGLAERLGAGEPNASIVYAGDDLTDEDAMRALRAWRPQAVTIHVRGVAGMDSAAELVVESPAALAVWLESLAGVRGAPGLAGETA
jgi:trehalose-phosphatase